MSRTVLKLVGKWVVATLLFLQLAVAAYACPSPRGDGAAPCAQQSGDATQGARADPIYLDPAAPNLCQQHCQQGSQAVDSGTPVAAPMIALPPLLAILAPPSRHSAPESGHQPGFLTRETEPPCSIRFCVLRV